jgi:hypothetical protein
MNARTHLIKRHHIDTDNEPPHLLNGKRQRYFPTIFRDLGYTVGAEIGVLLGRFSEALCQKIPTLQLYAVDAWKPLGWYETRFTQDQMDDIYREAVEKLALYDGCTIVRGLSQEVVEQFEDESLDFVFLDAQHDFVSYYSDIDAWQRKVRAGGIVSGHDYFNSRFLMRCRGKDAVDVYTLQHEIKTWFVVVGDLYPSWFWVK